MAIREVPDVGEQAHHARPDSAVVEPQRERRYIFSGDPQERVAGYVVRPNKRGVRRKLSTFNVIVALFVCAAAIILYIGNVIEVNRLALEVNQLQSRHNKIMNSNEALRAEISRKSSLERIGKIATEELRMKYPNGQAIWFDIDLEKLEELLSE